MYFLFDKYTCIASVTPFANILIDPGALNYNKEHSLPLIPFRESTG